ARIKHLLCFVIRCVEINLRLSEDRAGAAAEIVTVNRGRHREAGERIKRFRVSTFATKPADTADARQYHPTHQRTLAVEKFHFGMGVCEIKRDELIIDEIDALQALAALRNCLLPLVTSRVRQINGNHATTRRLEIGSEVEDRPDVIDETIVRIEFVEQFHYGSPGGLQVLVIKSVASVGALPNRDD